MLMFPPACLENSIQTDRLYKHRFVMISVTGVNCSLSNCSSERDDKKEELVNGAPVYVS